MENKQIGKMFAVIVVILFLGTCIIPVMAQEVKKTSPPSSKGSWLYVGGSGPGNYSTINQAMENASNGDTIFVYSGLYERVVITKSLTIIGENKYTTILDGMGIGSVVHIRASHVNLSGFTIQNGGTHGTSKTGEGIDLQAQTNIRVFDVILTRNIDAMKFYWCRDVRLEHITFINKAGKINFWDNINVSITHCIFDNSGIYHGGFSKSTVGSSLFIRNNLFTNNSQISMGELAGESRGLTIIESNIFRDNTIAITSVNSNGVHITGNNFINNFRHALPRKDTILISTPFYINHASLWTNNYWDDWNQKGSYTIWGLWRIGFSLWIPLAYFNLFLFLYREYDHTPAEKPYDFKVEIP
ncbi:MAG: hypothetical protein R6V50_05090 [Thermoplasmatota archaeon]